MKSIAKLNLMIAIGLFLTVLSVYYIFTQPRRVLAADPGCSAPTPACCSQNEDCSDAACLPSCQFFYTCHDSCGSATTTTTKPTTTTTTKPTTTTTVATTTTTLPPRYYSVSDNSSSSVQVGKVVNVSTNWTAATNQLAWALVRTNITGSWANYTSCFFNSGTTAWCNKTITTSSYAGNMTCWNQWANSTTNAWNNTMTNQCFYVWDYPQWTSNSNSTNTTIAGNTVAFRIRWTDNDTLSGHIISIDNCTNTFVNLSWTSMKGIANWTNATSFYWNILNITICTYKWKVFVNDTQNKWNVSDTFSFLTSDITPPPYSLNSTNSTFAGTAIEHRLKWNDTVGLGGFIFSFWNGTDLINKTPVSVTANSGELDPYYANKTIDDNLGTDWEAYAESHWVVYDLGVETLVTGVRVYSNKYSGGWTPCNVTVYVSSDTSNWGSSLGECNFSDTTDWHWCDNTDKAGRYINLTVKTTAIGGGNCGSNNLAGFWEFDFNSTGLYNDTWVSMTGTGNWSNVTKTVNSTVGATIKWCVYANDTSNNWNGTSCQNPFSYSTTGGNLIVNLTYPPIGTTNVNQYSSFNVNATVTCINSDCGTVYGTVRYNESSAYPDTPINSTTGAIPFYNASGSILQSCGSLSQDQSCQLNWTVNATGSIDSAYKVGVLFNSSYSSVTQNHTDNATIQISGGNLIVNLTYPPIGTTNVNQYSSFNVNATVTCINSDCGTVYGTVRYNASSANPDTAINLTKGAAPFYIVTDLLYVDSNDTTYTEWNAYGSQPYLNAVDYPTNYINSSNADDANKKIGNFGFQNTSLTYNINEVWLELNMSTMDVYNKIQVFIWNTTQWYKVDVVDSAGSWSLKRLNVIAYIDTVDEVNSAKMFLNTSGLIGQWNAVDMARLNVTYKEIGFNNIVSCGSLSQDQSCQLNWTVNATGSIDSAYKVGVLFNSSYSSVTQNHTDNATIQISGGNLIVNLTYPPIGTTNVNQYSSFNVNATVTCINSDCGTVYGTVRYNGSSANPDTPINSTEGNIPFYNASGSILQSCGSLSQDQSCQLNWTVNATGAIDSAYKVGVLFNSSYATVTQNHTNNATVQITGGRLEVNLTYPPNMIVNQNATFNVNATVTCRNGSCGNVFGTVRYNESSAYPDTPINSTTGATPFYIINRVVDIHPYQYNGTEDRAPDNPEYAYDDGFNDAFTYAYFYADADPVSTDTESVIYEWNFLEKPQNGTLFYTWKFDSAPGYPESTAGEAYIYFYNWDNSGWDQILYNNSDISWGTYNLEINSTYFNSTGGVRVKFKAMAFSFDFSYGANAKIWLNDTYISAWSLNSTSCGNMNEGNTCRLGWVVNATGAIDSVYKVGVLFNSSYTTVTQNHTNNATITIIECTESMNIGWSSIYFGNLRPNTTSNSAPGNLNNIYNITNTGTCTLKIWIKGTDIQNTSLPYPNIIGVSNFTWSNTTNDYSSSYAMTESYDLLNSSLTPTIKNITTYYWLRVPPVYAGNYTGTLYICENTTQQSGLTSTCT